MVEDEPSIAALVRMYLEREGFEVDTAADGPSALTAVAAHSPAAVMLDIGLPGVDGLEVCRRLRARPRAGHPAILFVTARDEEVDRIVGLELGGDDYVAKPFSPRELVARVKAVLRRTTAPAPAPASRDGDLLQVGRIRLSCSEHRVWADDREVDLTATEFALLEHLMRQPARVVSRSALLAQVWGYPDIASRTVDVHVAQLRAKLGDASPLRTVRGVGYAVDPPPGTAR